MKPAPPTRSSIGELDLDGAVLASSPNLPDGQLPVTPAMRGAALAGRDAIDDVPVGPERIRLLARPLHSERRVVGVVLVGESQHLVDVTLRRVRRLLLIAAASAAATSLIGPEGELLAFVPYGEEQLLISDVDLERATGQTIRIQGDPMLGVDEVHISCIDRRGRELPMAGARPAGGAANVAPREAGRPAGSGGSGGRRGRRRDRCWSGTSRLITVASPVGSRKPRLPSSGRC